MSTLSYIKRVEKISPSMLDVALSAITGGEEIHDYDADVNYSIGTYIYRVVNNNVVVYKSNVDVTGTGTFDSSEWDIVNGLGDYSGIVISETTPSTGEIDLWFKPLQYDSVDIESIAAQIDPFYITYKYKMNGDNTLWDYINLPVGASPENTIAIVHSFVHSPVIAGIRSVPTCANGYPVITIATELFKDNTMLTGFDTDAIEFIEADAFKGCTSLSNLTIGNKLNDIASGAFDGCVSLEHVLFSSSVSNISANAFANCTSLTNAIFYNPNTVIDTDAFTDSGLTTIIGRSGSTAQSFAVSKGLVFIPLT